MLKDLSASTHVSSHYSQLIEGVCDDLLEQADKKIDEIKNDSSRLRDASKVGHDSLNKAVVHQRMRTENALKKPQHAWFHSIDNSYNCFIPSLKTKEHYVKEQSVPQEIIHW